MSSYSPNPTAAAQPAVTVRRSRRRIGILALLAIGTMINYLDRTVLGIAAPKLTAELGIDPAIMGILFSAFAWTYALAQIPGGLFLDRFGNKVTYFLSLTLWSLFTLFHGMAVGLKTLLLCRFGLGISEAPCFPVNSRVVSAWFPTAGAGEGHGGVHRGGVSRAGLLCAAAVLDHGRFRLAGAVRQRWRRRHSVCPGVVALLPRTA